MIAIDCFTPQFTSIGLAFCMAFDACHGFVLLLLLNVKEKGVTKMINGEKGKNSRCCHDL
jgi:hypothetical protein